MNKADTSSGGARSERQPYRVRLPGFIGDEEIGLGDVIKRATMTVGLQSCAKCTERATTLNHWLVFFGRRSQ
jgi:hypothetical protein